MNLDREKLLALGFGGILIIQLCYLGWLWYKSKMLAGHAEVIIQSGSSGGGITIKKAELQKAITSSGSEAPGQDPGQYAHNHPPAN